MSKPVAIEVIYPYYLGGEMLDGYQATDNVMAQASIDSAVASATIIERERIIKLLDIWDCNNDRCDCDSINQCIYRQQLIALIKGENK
jgi:hypothetical protein